MSKGSNRLSVETLDAIFCNGRVAKARRKHNSVINNVEIVMRREYSKLLNDKVVADRDLANNSGFSSHSVAKDQEMVSRADAALFAFRKKHGIVGRRKVGLAGAIGGKDSSPPKPFKWCCSSFKDRISNKCRVHSRYRCPDVLLDRHSDGKVGIIVHDGGCSMVVINYCPWCGRKLPVVSGDL